MVTTPRKNEDLKNWDTDLSAEERLQARNEGKRQKWLVELGTRWLGHPQYDGHYTPELHVRAAR